MSYCLIYCKVDQSKGGKVNFAGPFVAANEPTEALARRAAQKLIADNPSTTIITKVYNIRGKSVEDVMPIAERYFDRVRTDIKDSIDMQKRSADRRKRRR